MTLSDYIKTIGQLRQAGKATEHSYRPALQAMLEGLLPNTVVTNEPKRQRCGAPDYILTRHGIDIGYIEAKDIGVDLNKTQKDEQLKRYLESLDNLILTDYMGFRFFLNGQKVGEVQLAQLAANGQVQALPENFAAFENLIKDFGAFEGHTIKTAKELANMMAKKAKLMRDVFFKAVSDKEVEHNSLAEQLAGFKQVLVHDMDEAQFADVYAQTIAYGLFTARLHDLTPKDFSRHEARDLIPRSNPFLRQLFDYVAGAELDSRVHWIVDALCEVFRYADLPEILKDFGKATGQRDPILHFYETFLAAYDPALRKARGVWYTPEPVVGFIVRAVDHVLKTHFGLPQGLADNSKIEVALETTAKDKKGQTIKEKRQIHKVQVLDVATGTGTFLAEIIKQVYGGFANQQGLWSSYVEQDLLPRLHGFELLMASYAMCHMKLDMLLTETGYKPQNTQNPPRVGVYLANSLEEYHPETGTLFASWLSREANEANRIKKDMPIMVAIGNPPYSGISTNKGEWITSLIENYKYIDGVHFNERKHWLGDDYVKFIRLGEHYIAKNGEGVLAYITNHRYLDNPTCRGMRCHLLNTFDNIYVLDLHGDSKNKEKSPDGSPDMNVFDIQKGVAIMVAVKHKNSSASKDKKPLANVHHAELYGPRDSKYEWLNSNSLQSPKFKPIDPQAPFYFFRPRNTDDLSGYNEGFKLEKLFQINSTGVQTSRDNFVTDFSKKCLIDKLGDFCDPSVSDNVIRSKYFQITSPKYLAGDTRDWDLSLTRRNIDINKLLEKITYYSFRPFDTRFICYSDKVVAWSRSEVGSHLLNQDNVALVLARSNKSENTDHFFITKYPSDVKYGERSTGSIFCPLYTYEQSGLGFEEKRPNLNRDIVAQIEKAVGKVTPEQLFDYIYAVLHSPTYRTRYAEFLKSDFPRIPYPADRKVFNNLVALGGQLRDLHLLESTVVNTPISTYPIAGDHVVDKLRFEPESNGLGKVWINATQYFGQVPQVAWEFYIGGYQPAQKWLKDRKGRTLTTDDLRHYQRMIVALTETAKLMTQIDAISFLPLGGDHAA